MINRITKLLLIQPDERSQIVYFLSLFLIIGCGMSIGRVSAEALFFKRYGIEHLPLIYLFQGGLLFVVTLAYASYADRIAPERLLRPLIIILCGALLALWMLMNFYEWEPVYPIYFLLYELVSEIFVVHCMLYVAQNFNVMQSKRLTPLIWGGWQIGSVLGAVTLAATVSNVGLQVMLLVWLVLMVLAGLMITAHHKKAGLSPYHRAGRKGGKALRHAFEQLSQGLSFAQKSDLLKAMSLALFFMVITFYVLCYSVNRVYTSTFTTEAELTMFFGILGATTGTTALIVQIFITNRLIRRFGVRNMNLLFPGLTLLGFSILMFSFALPAAIFASLIKDAFMPAIRNPVRALFFNALPASIQGRSHAVSVGIVLPLALAVAGLTLMLAQQIRDVLYFLGIGLITGMIYFFYSYKTNQSYVSSLVSSLRKKLFVPDDRLNKNIQGDEDEALRVLEHASTDAEPDIRFAAARTMLELFPERAGPVALKVLSTLAPPLRDQLFKMLAPLEPPKLRDYLWQELSHGDLHLRATAMHLLFSIRDTMARALAGEALRDSNPRILAMGIYGAMHYPVEECSSVAMSAWRDMFASDDKPRVMAALDLLMKWPNTEFTPRLTALLQSDDSRIQFAALQVVKVWPNNQLGNLAGILMSSIDSVDPATSVLAADCIALLDTHDRERLATLSLENNHPEVRQAAARALFPVACGVQPVVDWLAADNGSPRAHAAVLDVLLGKNPPRKILEILACQKAGQANYFLEAQRLIEATGKDYKKGHATAANELVVLTDGINSGLDMLAITLLERCHQLLDQALLVARQYEDASTVGVIRAGLKCDDRQHLASASEAVRYIRDQTLADVLVTVLEKLSGEPVTKNRYQIPFSDLASVLAWLTQKNDPWLSECVKQTKGGL